MVQRIPRSGSCSIPLARANQIIGIVICINDRYPVLFGKTDILVFAQQILLLRMDVRVVEKNGILNTGRLNGLHHLTRTRSAARMQQQLAFPRRELEFFSNQFHHFLTSNTSLN